MSPVGSTCRQNRRMNSEAARDLTPEIRGNSIVAGAKSLSVDPNGSLVLTTGGQTVTFLPNFRTDSGWTTYFSHLLKKSLEFDSDTKTFTTIAHYPLDKKRTKYFVYK